MKINDEGAHFDRNEIPELMTVLAIAADPLARGAEIIKIWADRKYEELVDHLNEKR